MTTTQHKWHWVAEYTEQKEGFFTFNFWKILSSFCHKAILVGQWVKTKTKNKKERILSKVIHSHRKASPKEKSAIQKHRCILCKKEKKPTQQNKQPHHSSIIHGISHWQMKWYVRASQVWRYRQSVNKYHSKRKNILYTLDDFFTIYLRDPQIIRLTVMKFVVNMWWSSTFPLPSSLWLSHTDTHLC